MIHPILKNIPDRTVMEACNDAFSADYTYLSDGQPNNEGRGFPTEPAHIAWILPAYLDSSGDIRRQFVGLAPDLITGDEAADAYSGLIDPLHERQEAIFYTADQLGIFDNESGLQGYYVNQLIGHGKRLASAYMIARALSGNILCALAYPKSIYSDLPLRFRDAVTPAVKRAEEERRLSGIDRTHEVEEKLRPFLRLEQQVYNVGAVAAASFLPESSLVRRAIS